MNLTAMLDQIAKYVVVHSRAVIKATPGVMHSISEFIRSTPNDAWAMCAFVAAASIMVTVVTAYLWPRDVPSAPVRETVDATGVRRLAKRGAQVPDIARRTGLSHDAVATILRASTLRRGELTAPMRKSRPTTA
jgi:lambda repressor-like predicted transcriptional regulator